jgi:hypothetical protein
MKYKPYNTIEIHDDKRARLLKYDDYSIRIKGIVYEVSVCRDTHELFINKDENQGD